MLSRGRRRAPAAVGSSYGSGRACNPRLFAFALVLSSLVVETTPILGCVMTPRAVPLARAPAARGRDSAARSRCTRPLLLERALAG